jgi:K+-transporting ATPase ATPase C chain
VIRPAVVSLLVFTLLLGVVYPVIVGVIGLAIPHPPVTELVGQSFDDPAYFWSRPSGTTGPYNAMASSGVNAGPTGFVDKHGTLGPNPVLVDAVQGRIQALHDADPGNSAPVPIDLVTASASGLDPHISPAAAYYQVARVARLRGVAPDVLTKLVDEHVEERTLGFLGERRVNVVLLNGALDAKLGRSLTTRERQLQEDRRE